MSAQSETAVREWTVHATAVLVGAAGVLIRGRSGAGKSSLALALLGPGEPASSFARIVGDDRVLLRVCHGRIVARSHPAIVGLIEQRGESLLHLEQEPAAVIRCVVDLIDHDPRRDIPPRLPDAEDRTAALGDVILPKLALLTTLSAPEAAWRVRAFIHRLLH